MKNTRKKRILFLSWKDINHPGAGGAELLTDTLATHMAQHYEVEYFTSSYPGALPVEQVHGYTIIRKGNIYTTYLHAFLWWHWNRMYHKKYSCIIDQVHGIPFFSLLYIFHPPINTLVMEIAGELWQKNYPNSIGIVGKILERIWLALYRSSVITTISESTKNELLARHIPARHIYMIPMFSPMQCNAIPIKATSPTLLMVGRIAPVKRIEDAIEAYKIAHKSIPSLQFVIIGRTESMYAKYTSYLLQ
ncbi:MAG TPA: glycosyltransferase family 4 protein, partial [Candidatus Andersenbacteria bacterium]|nr:glycosyltransferase family 4 protein [Candidatus Andersenbacteria bacterium]